MFSLPYLTLYMLCGTLIVLFLLPRVRMIARIWLGCCLGILLMMWLPFLCGLIMNFTLAAHLTALIPLFLLTGASWFFRDKRSARAWDREEKKLGILLLCTALPLTILGGYLQFTHILRPAADGSLHVGQSTYGDLNLHLAIASSLRNASLPADYNIFPGELLSYPFLMDSFSTSFMLLGSSLRFSMVFPGTLMMALTFSGYLILAVRMADTKRGAVLATLLFFLNGGLGFLYILDMKGMPLGSYGVNQLQSQTGLWNRIKDVLFGWYQAPCNHAEFTTYNLRWSNVICDMMLPQRTLLGGWCQLLPCMYLLYDAVCGEGCCPCQKDTPRNYNARQMAVLGIWAGGLPLLHTHSFLALGLMSAGLMLYDLFHSPGQKKQVLTGWLLYGILAVLLASPQLFGWTFKQTTGNEHFLTFHFNWVNNPGSRGMLDGYFWFYIKNIGLPFIMLLLSLFEKNGKRRFLASGAFAIFILAEFIQFQPNEYDNNKLFYVWYMICAVLAADYMIALYDRLKGLRSRKVIAVLTCFVCFASAGLTIAREAVSDYTLFSYQDVEAAEFIENNTEEHSTFISWNQHINPVSSLAGRNIVCGPSLWLYWHGYDITGRTQDIISFYADPVNRQDILQKYHVDYIFSGSYERSNMYIDEAALEKNFDKVFESSLGEIVIYAVEKQHD